MARHNIEKFSFVYGAIKTYARLAMQIYYKKIESVGYEENVPKGKPLIFAPNHQNALIDAFAVLFTQRGQIVFLARSDIFENSVTNKILTVFKILPIFRIRDGIRNLSKNQAIFEKTVDILQKNRKLAILPEGNHGDKRRLRPLKKGIARIAFQSAEKSNFTLDTQIIPVGIEYSDYIKFQGTIFVKYGEPIEVSKYYRAYQENPQRTMGELLKELSDSISKLMIDIKTEEYYELYEQLRITYRNNLKKRLGIKERNLHSNLISDKVLIKELDNLQEKNPAMLGRLNGLSKSYFESLKKLGLRNWVFEKTGFSFLSIFLRTFILLIFSPLFLFGFINNYIPFKIPVWFVNNKIKDLQFHSSIKFGIAIFLFPVFYGLILLIATLSLHSIQYGLIYIVSMAITGLLSFEYYVFAKKTIAMIKFIIAKKRNHPLLLQTIRTREEICEILNELEV